MPSRCGSRLSSSAAILVGIEFRLWLGSLRTRRLLLRRRLPASASARQLPFPAFLFRASCLSASAIGSASFPAAARASLPAASASATFGLGVGTGGGGGLPRPPWISGFFSVDLRRRVLDLGSSARPSRPTGLGVSAFFAFVSPDVIAENVVAEMMSTGNDSVGSVFSGVAENEMMPHARKAAWPTADMVRPLFISGTCAYDPCSTSVTSATRREARRRQPSHHLHHRTVIDLLVAAHIDALLGAVAAARCRNRLQLRHQLVHRDLGVLQKHAAARCRPTPPAVPCPDRGFWPGSAAGRSARRPSAAAPTP